MKHQINPKKAPTLKIEPGMLLRHKALAAHVILVVSQPHVLQNAGSPADASLNAFLSSAGRLAYVKNTDTRFEPSITRHYYVVLVAGPGSASRAGDCLHGPLSPDDWQLFDGSLVLEND